MKKVLLHICCGVCAFGCVQRLQEEDYHVEGFFYNPNIYPKEEHKKRKEGLEALRNVFGVTIHEGMYNHREWSKFCSSYAKEPEGGIRCCKCYHLRLGITYEYMKEKNFDYFTSTLTISPHKKSTIILGIGKMVGDASFLAIDFKKKDGFKKTCELAKQHNMYHQNYCGCLYSIRK